MFLKYNEMLVNMDNVTNVSVLDNEVTVDCVGGRGGLRVSFDKLEHKDKVLHAIQTGINKSSRLIDIDKVIEEIKAAEKAAEEDEEAEAVEQVSEAAE